MTSSTIPRRNAGHIEPLEARIAPATILIGARGLADSPLDTEYVDDNAAGRPGKTSTHPDFGALNFVDIGDGSVNKGAPNLLFDPIAEALRGEAVDGTDLDTTPNRYFYLRLRAGDSVVAFVEGPGYDMRNPLISVTGGDVIAVFTDFITAGSSENNYDPGEFTGLILGPGAKVQVNGSVNGDIVTALDTHKTANPADDTLDFKHLGGSRQNISSLKVLGGSVSGSVFSGGNIDSITIIESVDNVFAGTAANSHRFDFVKPLNPLFADGRFTSEVTFAPRVVGASIGNALLHDVIERVEAGAGGFGAKGGSLTNITVTGDTDGFALIAGDGGSVDLTSKVTIGGAGGNLTKINVLGTTDFSFNSVGTLSIDIHGVARTLDGVMLVAGDGGGSVVGNTAVRGGAGGSVTGVTAGVVRGAIASDLSADSFHIFGGLGGNGKTGGMGGSITSATVFVSARDVAGNEIEIVAGQGGSGGVAGVTGGAAGAGGNITTAAATNTYSSLDPAVSRHASIFVRGGDGGLALDPSTTGAAGGSLRTVTLVGFDSEVTAGSGSDGKSGGKGGSITTLNYSTNQTVLSHNIAINAGHGGDGGTLAGGAGGTISGVKAPLVDLETLYVNTAPNAGGGGSSASGRGGAGGAVTNLDVTDADKALVNTVFINGDVQINAGAGGHGGSGGGVGGGLTGLRVEGDHFAVAAQAGQGGDATVKGAGGAGGVVSVAFFKSEGKLTGVDVDGNPILLNPGGSVAAGSGGSGAGAGGRGGAGGDLKGVSSSNEGDGVLRAGSGGSGQVTVGLVKGGAAGKGGTVSASGMISDFGSGSIIAGDAGADGAAAGAGGSIIGSAIAINGVRAAQNITIQAGHGSQGGAGGDINTLGFAGIGGIAPKGKIVVHAGDGSAEGSVAGRGGNINAVTGVASSLVDGTISTLISAGNGGGEAGAKASGAGGNVTASTIATGGARGAIIVVEAGNAGNSSAAVTGGKGGSVTDVGFAALQAGTIIRSIAAGEGGIGTSKGGAGGSITKVFAPENDLGYRTGKTFGYSTQGGLFAGVGGAGGKSDGVNGSVTGVTATAVSSIVAGARNSPIPHLAEKVADISLNGTSAQLLLGRNDIFVPGGDFVLSFKGESTGLINARTQASSVDPLVKTIQSELNKLSTIQAEGGVVVEYTTSGGYVIKFNNKGAQPLIDAVEIVTRDVVEVIPNSAAALAFAAATEGAVSLPITASQPGVTPFSATILVPGSALFVAEEITSGNANSGTSQVESFDVSSITGVANAEFTLSFIGETTARIPANASAGVVEFELNNLPAVQLAGYVSVTQSGSVYTITFDTPGRQPLMSGQTFLQEVERLDLSSIQGVQGSQFTLTFNGKTTRPIAVGASAGTIQNELNLLSSVQATNQNFTGTVGVTQVAPGVFDVIFSENGFQSAMTGTASVPAVQTVHVTGAASDTFVIKSGDQVTPEFQLGATAEQVEVELNKLPNIIAASGVTVTKVGADYLIKFNQVGVQDLLEPTLLQKEKQTVDLSANAGTTTDYTIRAEYPVFVNEVDPGDTEFQPVTDGNPSLLKVQGDQPNTGRVSVVTRGDATTTEVERINFGQTSSTGGSAAALKDGDLFILKYTDTLGAGGSTQNSVVIEYTSNITTMAARVQSALNAMPLLKGGVTVARDTNASFPNAVLVTYAAKSAQVVLQTETHTPTPHPGGYELFPSYISTPVEGGVGAEVQVINLNTVVARGGVFNLTFAGQTTPFIASSNNIIANDIAAQLNALSAISDFGGVAVTETAPGSHSYTVTFQSTGPRPQITGSAVVPESEGLNISSLALDPTNEFTLSFRGDTTPVLPQNANAAMIQQELNKLPSVKALSNISGKPGTVKVFGTGPGNFRVDFPNYLPGNGVLPDTVDPDLPNIVIASGPDSFHEIQHIDLRSLTAYADGLFTLKFNGEETQPLPQDATAQDIENALNNLFSVIQTREDVNIGFTGEVAVTQTAHGEFDVKFNVFGQMPSLTGSGTVNTDRFPITVTPTVNGAPAIITVTEQESGAYTGQPVIELVKGGPGSQETQRIDLSTFNGAGLSDVTIAFGGSTSAPLTFTDAGGAPTPAQVAAAINALPTAPAGGVSVSGGNGVYDVTFATNGDRPSLVVKGRHLEVQQIDLGSLYAAPSGEYVLNFGGQNTASLAHDATAAEISAALNALDNVQNAGGVTVEQVGTSSKFNVTFRDLGDPVTIAAVGGLTHEIQRIFLGELAGRSDAQFKLTFNGQTTGLLSANLSPSALAAEIQTALNALETVNDTRTSAANPAHTVSAIGQVSVTAGENGTFYVTFDARGDVPLISGYSVATQDRVIPVTTALNGSAIPITVQSADGTAGAREVQTLDLSGLTGPGASPEFQLRFDNKLGDTVSEYTTGVLKPGADAAATAQIVANALNALPSISAAGGVTVTVNPQSASSFDVQFNSVGNQETIAGAVGRHETQSVDVRSLAQFRLANDTVVEGDAANGTQEQQVIDLTGISTDFTLQFGTDRTVSLPANASIAEIEAAFNALPSVVAAGGASVAPRASTPTATRLIEVTFGTAADVAEITGSADSADGVFRLGINGRLTQALRVGLLDPNGPTTAQSLIDLADALNALPEVKALAGHDQGTVTVKLVDGSYQIEFNGLGDIPTLTAGGTFSVEQTADIHRITDGQANASVPLPINEATPGRVIGPVATTVSQGSVAVQEVQQLDLTNEVTNGTGAFRVNFNGQVSNDVVVISQGNVAGQIQNALNNMTAAGTVTVTYAGADQYQINFTISGDQADVSATDANISSVVSPSFEITKGALSRQEIQKLDLNELPNANFQVVFGGATANVTLDGVDQAANAARIESALDSLSTIPGGVTVTSNADAVAGSTFGTFNITFSNDGNVAQIQATSFATTEAVQGGTTNEVQHIDLSALQTSDEAGSTFALSYNGETTAPLSRFATAAEVQAALNALPQFSAANVTVQGSNGVFDVTFAGTADQAGLILAQAGNQEVQHIDASSLQGQGSPNFRLTFMSQVTQPIPANSSAAQVEFALNQLPAVSQAGGVSVTETYDAQFNLTGYDVKFNTFTNQEAIVGSVAVHEQLILDLHNLQNETGFITFSNGTNRSFPVPTDAGAFFIQFAINSISSNPVNVTQLHPGVFEISYVNAGSPSLLQAFINKDGNSVRVSSSASPAEIESALDNVSVSDVALTGANGLYSILFADNGDQPTIAGTANVHEQLRVDIFNAQGSFHIEIGSEQTVELPANATADQVRLALNELSAVRDLGGVKDVRINADSSFHVTFAGDYNLPAIQFVARQNLLKENVVETAIGDANTREVQTLSYTIQGAFDKTKFAAARLVGAIADFNEFDSNRFHFFDMVDASGNAINGAHFDANGVPVDGNNVPLLPTVAISNPLTGASNVQVGDLPIDGIVMARIIDAKTTNFIPEALMIANPDKTVGGTLFFDYLNGR